MVVLLLLEAGLRLARYERHGTMRAESIFDAELGWVPTPDYASIVGGSRRHTLNHLGARLWGTHPGREKVLYVGDSFTAATDVADDETYYHQFSVLSGLDTYAIGAGGYGTLQETGLLARVLGSSGLVPDVLVLQFCGNDFVDNSATLESESVSLVQRIRPYRGTQGEIVHTLGGNRFFVGGLRWSAVFRLGVGLTEGVLFHLHGGDSSNRLSSSEREAAYAESVRTTRDLLAAMRKLVPAPARAYAFNCSEEKWGAFDQNPQFMRLAREAGFSPLAGARPFVDDAEGGRASTLARDGGHLNAVGNRRLAEFLVDRICAQEPCLGRATLDTERLAEGDGRPAAGVLGLRRGCHASQAAQAVRGGVGGVSSIESPRKILRKMGLGSVSGR